MAMPAMLHHRVLATGVASIAILIPAISGIAQQEAAVTCTNPASGASWQISIDYAKATVDSQPARISQGQISWFDPKDLGNNTLDRKTGDLTTSIASSTGGYFRRARCDLGQAR
ncbi:MAG: hypothetical protein JO213_09690 [Alphaproteobacteria bacterium]|nr:hypothetical protein [Alphaproteobacteria bacterium]MBV9151399.1 hypothetical protein [Alphaproteobacteria bacterium]MBV9585143.1 hypothetical protein [Alphaproteobacteria bacterium]